MLHVCRNVGQKMKNLKTHLQCLRFPAAKYSVDSFHLSWALKCGPLVLMLPSYSLVGKQG